MTTLAFPLNGWQQQVSRFLEQALPATGDGAEWAPRSSIHEDDQQLTLEIDVPGIQPEDLEVRVEKDQLSIRGERKPRADLDQFRRVEQRYGAFARVFALPEFVRQEAIAAELNHGVLTLHLPKRDETKPRQIAVKVAVGEGAGK